MQVVESTKQNTKKQPGTHNEEITNISAEQIPKKEKARKISKDLSKTDSTKLKRKSKIWSRSLQNKKNLINQNRAMLSRPRITKKNNLRKASEL